MKNPIKEATNKKPSIARMTIMIFMHLVYIFFIPAIASAAIAWDASGLDNGNGNSPHTFTNQMAATSTTNIVVLGIEVNGGNTDSCTGVTANGVTATRAGTPTFGSGTGEVYTYWAMNVGGTLTVNTTGCTANQTNILFSSYTGAQTTGQLDAYTTGTAASPATSITTSLTTIQDNTWEVSFCTDSAGVGLAASTGVTSRTVAYGGYLGIGDSNAAIHPAGANSQTWTGNAGNFACTYQSIIPVASASGPAAQISNWIESWWKII